MGYLSKLIVKYNRRVWVILDRGNIEHTIGTGVTGPGSIALILDEICNAIREGLEDRKSLKSADKEESTEKETADATAEAASNDKTAE